MSELGVLPPKQTVLLTGAGFSRPFGGLLAAEMWAAILTRPEVRQSRALRDLLLSDLDYESVYGRVLTDASYPVDLRRSFTEALRGAYAVMDEAIRSYAQQARRMCPALLTRFAPATGEQSRGFIFTLNQDLLVERYYSCQPLLSAPGFTSQRWFNGRYESRFTLGDREELVSPEVLDARKNAFLTTKSDRFAYVKLHGSLGWTNRTDEGIMINGPRKSENIQSEPLLAWYLSLFRHVLNQSSRNLVVIGYGFGDPHINDAIADATRDHGLRLYVVSRESPYDFKEKLIPVHGSLPSAEPSRRGTEVWNGLHGYHCGSVEELYEHCYNVDGRECPPTARALLEASGLMAFAS